ncbi:glycosyltransferase [Pontibacter kalidii]|uniref:glycosyltransferase n=1 Tax=Pontibacter kalidii TaxID=2592049 RepID=UPI0022547FB2|nr:glycosyltransferase [Pontibacter kalidii]
MNKKIKVLHCIESIHSGGVEKTREIFARLYDKNKYELKIVCTRATGPIVDSLKEEGVELIEIGILDKVWRFSRYKAVLKVISGYKPHIIHGAVFEGVLLASIAGYIGRVPAIVLEETSDPQNRTKKATYLLKLLSGLSDKVIGVSPAVYSYLKDVANIKESKLRLINNGIYPPVQISKDSVQSLKDTLGIQDDDIIIGSVGRLRNFHKLFTDLIDALSILHKSNPRIKVLIVGDGPDREEIEQHILNKGLSDHVIIAGFQPDPHPFFEIMDIFAIVSHMEAFGLVAVEAMFHKLPVIATNVGGLKDVVLHNETGLLVEAHHPEQIANAINTLLSNRQLMVEMGERGFARANNQFSAGRYVEELENLYSDLIAKKGIELPAVSKAFK